MATFPDGTKLPRPVLRQWKNQPREGLKPLPGEHSVPIARPGDVLRRLGAHRMFIIDSGASINASGAERAKKHLSRFIRDKCEEGTMSTANGRINVNSGMRMSIASWDIRSDYTIMPSTPELVSMGERCWGDEFTFV